MLYVSNAFAGDPAVFEKIARGLSFILSGKIDGLSCGRHELADGIFVNVMEYDTQEEKTVWEAHRRYADIHYIISGTEMIGYAPVDSMRITDPYKEEGDAMLGTAKGELVTLREKECCALLPDQAHVPGLAVNGTCHVKKAVVKVCLD